MEEMSVEKRERPRLVPAAKLIPGLDEGLGENRIKDAAYYADNELSAKNQSVYHPNDERWMYLVSGDAFRSLFSFLRRRDEQIKERLKNIFSGNVLVDLGGGEGYNVRVASELFSASGYVLVDPHSFKKARRNCSSRIPTSVVAEDALTFLRRVPDNSINILVSNVDYFVVNDPEMRRIISLEMGRALGGGALINDSDIFCEGIDFENWDLGSDLYVQTRKSIF